MALTQLRKNLKKQIDEKRNDLLQNAAEELLAFDKVFGSIQLKAAELTGELPAEAQSLNRGSTAVLCRLAYERTVLRKFAAKHRVPFRGLDSHTGHALLGEDAVELLGRFNRAATQVPIPTVSRRMPDRLPASLVEQLKFRDAFKDAGRWITSLEDYERDLLTKRISVPDAQDKQVSKLWKQLDVTAGEFHSLYLRVAALNKEQVHLNFAADLLEGSGVDRPLSNAKIEYSRDALLAAGDAAYQLLETDSDPQFETVQRSAVLTASATLRFLRAQSLEAGQGPGL